MSKTGRPKCSVCRKEHWGHEPHIWGDEAPRKVAAKATAAVEPQKVAAAKPVAKSKLGEVREPTAEDVAAWAEKLGLKVVPRRDKKEWAEYMRQYRLRKAKRNG